MVEVGYSAITQDDVTMRVAAIGCAGVNRITSGTTDHNVFSGVGVDRICTTDGCICSYLQDTAVFFEGHLAVVP